MISKWLITSLFAAGQGEVDEDLVRMLVDMKLTHLKEWIVAFKVIIAFANLFSIIKFQ